MKKMKDNPGDLSLLAEYSEYLARYNEALKKMSALGNEEMNDAELKYYLEVTTRVNGKLLDIAI